MVIYLAAPYTHDSVEKRNWRFHRAKQALFTLFDEGKPAVCPVVLGHEYEQRQRSGPKYMPHEFWMSIATAQLVACTHVYVLTLPGWDDSKGVGDEVMLAHLMNKAILGYQPFEDCEVVSGLGILKAFGLAPWKELATS